MKQFSAQKNKGYTLLFAVVVSTLVLSIGISILNIAKKEFLLATSARDSAAALYAADGGLECAIYSDQGTLLITGVPRDTFNPTTNKTANFGCNVPYKFVQADVNTSSTGAASPGEGVFKFHARFGSDGTSCAVVTVTKYKVTTAGVTKLKTNIQSRGYNTGWKATLPIDAQNSGSCDTPSAKRVERALSYSSY